MKKKYVIIALLMVLTVFVLKTCHDAGSFRSITSHSPGEIIKLYTSMPGTEDMDIEPEDGLLFISSSERRGGTQEMDGIYVLNIRDIESNPQKLNTTFNGSLHPHGISLLRVDSALYLHVVNHNESGNFIEIFEYVDNILNHITSISSPDMCCPNDVVAVDKLKCYITNDHGSSGRFYKALEDFLKIPRASILYYDGNNFSKVYGGLHYANGINISPDGNMLYATHTTGLEMLTFAIKPSDGSLTLLDRIHLNTGVDNIDVDMRGDILIGAHPRLFDFMGHARDSLTMSPSQVLKLTPGVEVHTDYIVKEVFLDDGSLISGSSVAVQFEGELFIGDVFDHKLLRIAL